ncbi:hypothetical protein BST61_g843 [Cercospora zeina]
MNGLRKAFCGSSTEVSYKTGNASWKWCGVSWPGLDWKGMVKSCKVFRVSGKINWRVRAFGSVLQDESRKEEAIEEEVDAQRVKDSYKEKEGDDQAMLRSEFELALFVLRLDVLRRRVFGHLGSRGVHDRFMKNKREALDKHCTRT